MSFDLNVKSMMKMVVEDRLDLIRMTLSQTINCIEQTEDNRAIRMEMLRIMNAKIKLISDIIMAFIDHSQKTNWNDIVCSIEGSLSAYILLWEIVYRTDASGLLSDSFIDLTLEDTRIKHMPRIFMSRSLDFLKGLLSILSMEREASERIFDEMQSMVNDVYYGIRNKQEVVDRFMSVTQ
jgi:hypothetical protein